MAIKATAAIIGAMLLAMVLSAGRSAGTRRLWYSDEKWEKQLEYMNFLVIRTSSINLINNLYLSKEQAVRLKELAAGAEACHFPAPDSVASAHSILDQTARVYEKLIGVLLSGNLPQGEFRQQVFTMRLAESDIIKRSLLAAQMPGYGGDGCLECHAPPALFPGGNVDNTETRTPGSAERSRIDREHIRGLLGDGASAWIWANKERVDSILTHEQKYTFKGFRCCLIPETNPGDPGIVGQSFVTDQWIEFFREARKLDESDWKKYRFLFIRPLEDLLEARLPGIGKKQKKVMLNHAGEILEEARSLNKLDFETSREDLCIRLGQCLSVDPLNGELYRPEDEKKFMTAVFLLFPGSIPLYDKILTQQ